MRSKTGTMIAIGFAVSGLALALTANAGYSQCDRRVLNPSISANGKIIAFDSCASNWAGNVNVRSKVFVYHRERHKILNTSINGPDHADDDCTTPIISADGKWVFYETGAENMIGGINTNYYVTNNTLNILACEIEESDFTAPAPGYTHKLISMAADGGQANSGSMYPVCSSNGRFVAFWTKADNLDPGGADTNYCEENSVYTGGDIYLRDRDLDGNGVFDEVGAGKTKTTRVSHDSDIGIWHQAWWGSLSISADGKFVSYTLISAVAPLGRGLGTCVYSVADGKVTLYRPQAYDDDYNGHLSPDGGYLVFGADFDYGGGWYRTLMYALPDTNWWYAAIPMNTSTGISVGCCAMSTGAHFTAFYSGNTNLAAGDMNKKCDVFTRVATGNPRNTERYELVSKSTSGEPGDDDSGDGYGDRQVGITPDGRFVVFVSAASNLVAVDTNALQDIFIRDRWSNTTEMVVQKVGNPAFPDGAVLTVSQVTNSSARLKWPAATDDFPIWEYRLLLASLHGVTQVTLKGTNTAYTATGLEPGTAYTAELYAYDGGGNHSEALTADFTTTGIGTGGPQINDYDGNGISELAVYDNNVGSWYAYSLQTGQATVWGRSWGWPGAETVPGDYDGDMFSDMAVYDQNTGCWYVWSEVRGLALLWARPWGWPGAETVYGDYDGDAVSDLAVYDQPSGFWYIITVGDVVLAWDRPWGWTGAITVPGDYDADGKNDLCVYDQNTGYWYVQTLAGTVLAWEQPWGWPGATTVPGDYDGDGKSDMAVYDQPTGAWYVWSQAKGVTLIWARPWGWTGAVPVPGDYDGDGVADLAVFDTITGYWYVWSEAKGVALAWAVNWGWPGANPPGGR